MVEVVISCLVILLHCSTNANKKLCTKHPVIIQITLFKNWWWLLHSALVHLQVYPLFSVSCGYCGPVTAIWSVLQAVPHYASLKWWRQPCLHVQVEGRKHEILRAEDYSMTNESDET